MNGDDVLVANLHAAGHATFKSLEQEDAVRALIAGHDVFAALPTGAGKTLIFRLAIACRGGVGIIISPLLSLIEDQLKRAAKDKVNACTFNGATSSSDKTTIRQNLLTDHEPVLLYVTAEMAVQPSFCQLVADLAQRKRLSLLCVDEAHVSTAWADNYRPAYARLQALRTAAPSVPLLLLTATARSETRVEICRLLGAKADVRVFRQAPRRSNLFIDVVAASGLVQPDANAVAFVVRVLERSRNGVAIVYCRSKASCNEYAYRFKDFGVRAELYHGDRSLQDRQYVQNKWTEEGVRVIIATVAFGLGIDKSNVRCVVHMDLPSSINSYAQEIGRAGRDGKPAYCRLYLRSSEARSARSIVQAERQALTAKYGTSTDGKRRVDERCRAMQANFDETLKLVTSASECRHKVLDEHFEFASATDCLSCCDVCFSRLR